MSKNRFLLTAAIVAALLLASWLLQDDADSGTQGELSSATVVATTGGTAEETPESLQRAAVKPIVPQPFSEAGLDVPVEELTTGRRLTVREQKSGGPVPGATVHVYDAAVIDHDRIQAAVLDRIDFEAALRVRPRRFKTDAQGSTLIPEGNSTNNAFFVTAFTPARWGFAMFAPQAAQPLEICVGPDCAVDLRVEHEDGTPASGHVVAARAEGIPNSVQQWQSDDHGHVHIASIGPVWRSGGMKPLLFSLAGVKGSESTPCDPLLGSHQELRLVVPATAPLRIRITGTDALPESARATLRVRVRTEGADQDDWLSTRLVSGIALTPPLPLGGRVLVCCQTPLLELENTTVTVDGPASRDDVRVVDVPLPPLHELFIARLVDGAGRPLVSTRIQLKCLGEVAHELARADLATNADGLLCGTFRRKEHPKPGKKLGPPLPPNPQRLLIMTSGGTDADALGVEVALPPLARGVNDLGTLTLVQPPLLVAGIVLDERREPFPRALVAATIVRHAEDGKNLGPEAEYHALSGADGRFIIRRFTPCREVTVVCMEELSLPPRTHVVAVGATNLEFVLARGGQLAGQVLMPEGIPASALRVRVVPSNTAAPWNREYRPAPLGADGRFRTELLPPGPAEVHIEDIDMLSAPLATVHAVEVLHGSITRDARLDPLDLSACRNTLAITVRNNGGIPLRGARVFAGDDLHRGGHRCDESGVTTFFVPRLPQDLVVTAPGQRDLFLPGVAGPREVRLRPSILVDLQLATIPATTFTQRDLEKPIEWVATLLDPQARGSTTAGQSGGTSLSPRMLFPAPGLWQLSARIPVKSGGRTSYTVIPLHGAGVIKVPDEDGPHRITVTMSEDALQYTLRKK